MRIHSFRTLLLAISLISSQAFAQSGAAFERAAAIRFPKIEFAEAPLRESVDFLVRTSRDLTSDKLPINVVIKCAAEPTKTVTLKVTNMPAPEAIRYCADAAGLFVTWSGETAIISDQKTPTMPTVAFDGGGRMHQQRASKIIIPKVDFRASTTREVLEFVSRKTKELHPQQLSLNIALNSPAAPRPAPDPKQPEAIPGIPEDPAHAKPAPEPGAPVPLDSRTMTFKLSNVSVPELLRIVGLMTDSTIRWDSYAVVFGAKETANRPQVVNRVAMKGKVLTDRLNSFAIPVLDFREARLADGCEFMVRKIKELDPEQKSINIVAAGAAPDRVVTLRLIDVPPMELLRYISELSGTELRIEHHAFFFQAPK